MPDVNLVAVLVAAIAATAWGAFYYSPAGAGKAWMKEMGFTKDDVEKAKKEGMGKAYALNFVFTLVMAYVLSHVIWLAVASGVGNGFSTGFWMWLGFIAPLTAGNVLWGRATWKLWFINNVFWVVNLLLMGAVITLL